MEVSYQASGYREVVWREDELIGPTFVFLQMTVSTNGCFDGTHYSSTYCSDAATFVYSIVYDAASIGFHKHLFTIHLMLSKVFYVDFTEVS